MTGLVLLLVCLAAYRLTRIITLDLVGKPIRLLWWKRWPIDTDLGEFIRCNWCVGWWMSGAVLWAAAGLGFVTWRWRSIVFWPVVAGGQALLSALDERLG